MEEAPTAAAAARSAQVDAVEILETYGRFVLNIKVLGSAAGAGVPTLPVRVPQIVDSNNQLSFSKLLEVVIMIASSQQSTLSQSPTLSSVHSPGSNQRVQHHVLLSFPNPQTQNSVMISSAEELLQLMGRYKQQQQLTLIAKVQQQLVQRTTSPTPATTTTSNTKDTAADITEQKQAQESLQQFLNTHKGDEQTYEDWVQFHLAKCNPTSSPIIDMPDSFYAADSLHRNLWNHRNSNAGLTLPDLDKGQHKHRQEQPTSAPLSYVPTSKPLQFDPPKFALPPAKEDSPTQSLTSLMEQLLEIQSNRMIQFANHMEDRIQQIVEQRMVTSEDQLKHCLRDTVQLVQEEDCKEDDNDSVSTDDTSNPQKAKTTAVNTHNLEKIVKDQMVSMELRFAKLEEHSKETAAIAKLSPQTSNRNSPTNANTNNNTNTPDATTNPSSFQQQLHSRLQNMEQLMVATRQDIETTKNATIALANASPTTNATANARRRQSPNTKPPLPPTHRSTIAVEPLLLPRLSEGPPPHPVSPSILSLPLPPSIPSSPARSRSPSPTPRRQLQTPPPSSPSLPFIRPVSPPTTGRDSLLVPPPLEPLSPPNSRRSSSATNNEDDTTFTTNTSNEEADNTPDIDDSARTPPNATIGGPPLSPDQVQSSRISSLTMPSLAEFSIESARSIPTKKKTVGDMLRDKSKQGKGKSKSDHTGSKKSSIPIMFPMLDTSKSDGMFLSTPESSPPEKQKATTSAFSSPPSQIQAPPLAISPTTTPPPSDSKDTAHHSTDSEIKMKKAIKDHMQSMESRVSKLREINKQSSTPAALTPATVILTSPRTLFSDHDDDQRSPSAQTQQMEKVLTQKMDYLAESLQSTIEDATKASVDTKLADLEALLQRKLQQMQKAVALAGSSAHGPPNSPKRRSSFPDLQNLEDLIDGRMDQLTDLLETNPKRVVQEFLLARTVVAAEGDSSDQESCSTVAASALMEQMKIIVDKRMDTMESLVQLTANELESNTKAAQAGMNEKLMEQLLEVIQNQLLPPTEDSIATSAFPTLYGDDDEESEQQQQRHQDENQSTEEEESTNDAYRPGRSLEADLVAMDRQASIRDIYGEMDIEVEELGEDGGEPNGDNDRGTLGRGKSLRDMCNIDTIKEEEEDSEDAGTSRHSDPGTILSVASSISARSASVRHIYGEESIDIEIDDADDDDQEEQKAPAMADDSKGNDTPPVAAKRTVSLRSIINSRSNQEGDKQQQDSSEPDDDEQEAPWLADRAEAARKDKPPSPVGRVDSMSTVASRAAKKKDKAPSLVDRAVSTRAIYGEADIEVPSDIQETSEGVVDGSVLTRAMTILGEAEKEEAGMEDVSSGAIDESDKSAVPSEQPALVDILDFYDGLDIDVEGQDDDSNKSASIAVYDDISLDGVEETQMFVSALDGSGSEGSSDFDLEDEEVEEDVDDEMSVSIDEDSAAPSIDDDYSHSGSSSYEDEEYFHDHARQHLAVLANSMTKIRAAKKATSGYKSFQDNIFISKREGPLAIKVQSVAEFDATNEGERKMTMSDDESFGKDSGQGVASDVGIVTDSDEAASSAADSFESPQDQYTRSKRSAFLVAMAVSDRRAANRAIREYRRMLHRKFVPQSRKGPLALQEDCSPPSDSSDVYIEDAGSTNELMASSCPSIDSGGGADGSLAASCPSIDSGASYPSIDTGGGLVETSGRGMTDSEHLSVSDPSIDSGSVFVVTAVDGTAKPVSSESLESQTTADSKALHSNSEGTNPPAECSSNDKNIAVEPTATKDTVSDDEDSDARADRSASSIFRKIPELTTETDGDKVAEQAKAAYSRSLDDDESLHLEDPKVDRPSTTSWESTPDATRNPRPTTTIYQRRSRWLRRSTAPSALPKSKKRDTEFNEDGVAAIQTSTSAASIQEKLSQEVTIGDEELRGTATESQSPSRESKTQSSPRSPPHSAEAVEEEGAFKPENPRRPPQPAGVQQAREQSLKTFDEESEGNLPEPQTKDLFGEEKEMEEWEAVANSRSVSGSTTIDTLLLSDHIQEVKAQFQRWEDIFLGSNEALRASNENLQSSVQESVDDSHHFAAYLDKMLTERIGQLEEAIRTQTALATQSIVSRNEQVILHPLTALATTSPPRVQSAPTTPMRSTWRAPTATTSSRSLANSDGESKEADHDGRVEEGKQEVIEVIEWKRLQDKLRGTEEVAEAYRKQVLQLRNVLEVKINEGNASQHQVELLQQKLRDAHSREVQAQKQLQPVRVRVEQVITEMVQLEEHSAHLESENARLQNQLWLVQREF